MIRNSLLLLALWCGHPPAEDQPNIVVIMADDLGWRDFRCSMVTKLDTPALDQLAAEGILSTHGHAA